MLPDLVSPLSNSTQTSKGYQTQDIAIIYQYLGHCEAEPLSILLWEVSSFRGITKK